MFVCQYCGEKDDVPPHRCLFKKPKEIEPAAGESPGDRDLRRQAAKWILKHPAIARLFLKYARAMASRKRRFSASLITERVRWHVTFNYGEKYKINNNHRAYIARWLIEQDPRLEEYLVFRKVRY